jgi:tRNA(Ile)-lysidine synthase
LIRPLLDVRRSEVLEYLAEIRQEFRTDATNADSRWTRNRIRNELLPALRAQYNTGVDDALRRLAQQAGECQQFIATFVADLAASCVETDSSASLKAIRINCHALSSQPAMIVREVCRTAWIEAGWPLQAMSFREWQQLAEIVLAGTNVLPLNLPGNVQAQRAGDTLVLAKLSGDFDR